MSKRPQAAGMAAVLTAVTAFSWGFVIVKTVDLPPAAIGFWRLSLGASVLGLAALVTRTPWPGLSLPILGAGLAFGAHQLLFIAATKATSIAIVTLVGAMQPLLVALVSRKLVGERVPPKLIGWSLVAVAGVVVVVQANLGDASRTLTGDLLAVANVVLFTAYFMFAKRAMTDGARTLTFTATLLAVALIVVAPAVLVSGLGGGPGALRAPTAVEFGLIAVLVLAPGNGHLLVNWAHRRLTAALSALVLAAIPLLASVWAHLVFGEPYGWRHVAGMLLVVAAIEGGRRASAPPLAGRTLQTTRPSP